MNNREHHYWYGSGPSKPKPPTHKTILYYRKDVYGNTLEYVADKGDASILQQLTGKLTINGQVRELIRDLSGGLINFQEVTMPK